MEKNARYKRLVDNCCMPCGYNEPCDSFIFSEAVINMLLDKVSQKDKEIERFMSMKNREQLVVGNEALKDTIAVVLAQKSNLSKLFNEIKQSQKQLAVSALEEVNGLLTDTIIEVTENEFNTDKLCYLEEISSKFSEKIKNKIKKIQGGNFS